MPELNVSDSHFPRLKQLWTAGVSALECGQELGLVGEDLDVRDAVLRAVERMSRPAPKIAGQKKPPRSKRRVDPEEDAMFASDGFDGTPAVEDLEIPMEQRRTVLQLNEHTCRWPVGDPAKPDFFFCGAKPLDGLPYCVHHSRRAYAPRPRRAA